MKLINVEMHNFDIDRIVKIVKDRRYRVIGLQLPEGLKDSATEIGDAVRPLDLRAEYVMGFNTVIFS